MTWDVEGDYGQGWEHVDSAETEEQAYEVMNVYRANQPGRYRVVLETDTELPYDIVIRYLNV